ncbi:MAG: glycosyltransferase family 4 protein [Anaerolineae bacterium]|nr:glycosyltransferase family 4 protein [Anaerolineae bacterium]
MDIPFRPPIHVAVNAHLLSGDRSYRSAGVHQYIAHLLTHLPDAGCQVTALVGPDAALLDRVQRVVRSRWPTRWAVVRVMWEQVAQPRVLRRLGAELVHAPVFVGPLVSPCPLVVTVHDLSFIRFPRLFRPHNRLYLTALTRASVHKARRVIAVSAHAAAETARLLDVDPAKISVVHHGVDPDFTPLPPDEIAAFRARHRLPERYILSLGTLEPRKNLLRLVEAFHRLRAPDLELVLAGGRGWYYQELFARVKELGIEDRVLFPGYVPRDELVLWYNAATVFALPSLYEGFGMPILEAQACGVPVLTSDCAALPEAAGDGALLVDPWSVEEIAAGLERLLGDAALGEQLREKGLIHASAHTWRKTAVETVKVYRQAVFGGGVTARSANCPSRS